MGMVVTLVVTTGFKGGSAGGWNEYPFCLLCSEKEIVYRFMVSKVTNTVLPKYGFLSWGHKKGG